MCIYNWPDPCLLDAADDQPSTMEERLQAHQNRLFEVLQSKLRDALEYLNKTIQVNHNFTDNDTPKSRFSTKKARFALFLSDHLDRTVADLEHWHDLFDPSWYLITRIANAKIDKQLDREPSESLPSLSKLKNLRDAVKSPSPDDRQGRSIFLEDNIRSSERVSIPYSTSLTAQRSCSAGLVLVDQMRCDPFIHPASVIRDVRDLARILSQVDPLVFGLLSCQGVVKIFDSDKQLTGFDFIFGVPPELKSPRSLREILLSQASNISLNERFSLAALLARSVFFMHTSHFVHKNIRPETIIVFQDSKLQLGKPFLVGFEKFRLDTSRTHRVGDDLWYQNIYRHPQRQGIRPEEDFIMQHDIYSLGVILLEIGLNYSFVQFANDRYGDLDFIPNSNISITELLSDMNVRRKANSIKKKLVILATNELPILMGQKYTQVVISCLTCLDSDNDRFGDESEFEDEDGIKVGVRFIEKVCRRTLKSVKQEISADVSRFLQSLMKYRCKVLRVDVITIS